MPPVPLVLPGGIDAHAHIEQLSAAGIVNSDTFESATASAAYGGTTSAICFAAQHVGMDLKKVVADYAALAKKGALIDYAFHLIIADPTEVTIREHIPALVAQGHASLKVFMTYDRLAVGDEKLLDILFAARASGALVCVHAENHGMITWMGKRLVEKGYFAPKYHTVGHPRGCEAEAFNRLITFAEFIDQPIMIFHVSTAEGVEVIRRARGRGLKVFAETCPQYLFMTAQDLDKPGLEGAKWMCSPPPRGEADQEAIWQGLALAICNSCPPIMRPMPSTPAASSALVRPRPSSRSPMACRGSSCACPCCSTPWSRRVAWGFISSSS